MGIPGEGVTDSDCGTQHADCPTQYGQGFSCQFFNDGASGYHGCACTPGANDSCAANTNGLTVCDSNYLFCRAPQDFEAPANGTTCATGYQPFAFSDGDGGTVELCAETCSADGGAGTCTQSWTSCDTADGLCLENVCTNFYQPCPTDQGATAGTCVPLPDGNGGYNGICEVNGTSASDCGGFFGNSAYACAQGEVCLGDGLGSGQDLPYATCFPMCDANTGNGCQASELCLPLNGATDAGFTAGYCVGKPDAGGGDSMGACGTSYQICRYGENCDGWSAGDGGGVPTFFACTCDTSAGDSCELTNDYAGGGGNVVCDSNTKRCRQPKDLEPIFNSALTVPGLCDNGYVYQDFGPLPGDAGEDFRCVQNCTSGQACNATWTACEQNSLDLHDGGIGAGCYANLCGAEPDGGFDVTASWTSCDAGGGTGRCQPLPSSNGGYVGYCLRTGSATKGQACNGFLGDVNKSLNCTQTEMCLDTGYPPGGTYADGGAIPTGTCFATCNAGGGGPSKTCGTGGGTCQAYTGDPAGTEQAGICQ